MTGLLYTEECMTIMLSCFDTIPERDRQTDGQAHTDGRQNCYINIALQC